MAKGRCLTLDVTVPDTFVTSHIASTSYLPGAAAEHTATLKKQKYAALSQTHEFVPLAIETSGVFNFIGLEFVKKIGSRICTVSSDEKETAYLFQRISVAIQTGNSILFSESFAQCHNKWETRRGFLRAIQFDRPSNIISSLIFVCDRVLSDFDCIY